MTKLISQLPFEDVSPPHVAYMYIKFAELHFLGMCEQFEANYFHINIGNIIILSHEYQRNCNNQGYFFLSSPLLHTPFKQYIIQNTYYTCTTYFILSDQ